VQLEPAELARSIAGGEGKRLEFKRGLPGDAKVARTLCAFANTRGGLLLIGVGDRGELAGAPRPRATMEHLRRIARERLEPPLAVAAGSVRLGGRTIVWCSVPVSPARPHAVLGDGGEREVVARVGASNRRATGATLRALQAQRRSSSELDPLQRRILAWLDGLAPGAAGQATAAAFARAHNVGVQRARRAFTRLELAGLLVGHGEPARRRYERP
jgi:predicted HTH transcriptional regulator